MRRTALMVLIGLLAASCAASRGKIVRENLPGLTGIVVDVPAEKTEDDVTVVVRPVAQPEQITVVDPDGQEKVRDTFNPYAYPGVVETVLFAVQVVNGSKETVQIPPPDRITVGRSSSGTRPALSPGELQRRWKDYFTRLTYTSAGWPNRLEQERSRQAEAFIDRTILKGGPIPPGSRMSGYLPVPVSLLSTGSWTITFPGFRGSRSKFPEVSFTFQVP